MQIEVVLDSIVTSFNGYILCHYTAERNNITIPEDDPTILLNGSYSTEDSTDSSTMGGNPLKKFHQKLLDKEQSRKDRIKSISEKLQFWRKRDTKEKTQQDKSVEQEEIASKTSKRQVNYVY